MISLAVGTLLLVAQRIPPKMFPVTPVVSSASPAPELRIARGRHFSYALPAGWRVGEDGQFALTLVAPDNHALTIMVGNAGLPVNYPPARFVQEKLMAMRVQNLQLSQPRPAPPGAGFKYAYQFQFSYSSQGVPWTGVAKCHIAPAYDTAVMAMTAALSVNVQWPGYAKWLPATADQVAATDGAAFGMRGIMAQNLQNSQSYAQAAREYREWSQKNWQGVTDQRNASQDKQNYYRRENLGSTQAYANPYDAGRQVELPRDYQYYWVNRQGKYLGTNDPSVNPNDGSVADWKPMPKHKP